MVNKHLIRCFLFYNFCHFLPKNWLSRLGITHSQAAILTAEVPTDEAVDWKVWRRRRPPSLSITRTSRQAVWSALVPSLARPPSVEILRCIGCYSFREAATYWSGQSSFPNRTELRKPASSFRRRRRSGTGFHSERGMLGCTLYHSLQ